MSLLATPPKGFRVSRTEDKMVNAVTYRVMIDRQICVAIPEEADLHADYVEQTIRHAVRQLALDVRDVIEGEL